MIDASSRTASGEPIEVVMRAELSRDDAMAQTVLPVLRYLVASQNASIFSDDILAHVRGMVDHLARELLQNTEVAGKGQHMADALLDHSPLLTHLHALALEWQLTEKLEARLALDPVVSPLLQELIAGPEEEARALAMKLLATQARWCQSRRRMQLSLHELPGDLLHAALLIARSVADGDPAVAGPAEGEMRAGYDEGESRIGLAARLVTAMDSRSTAALSVNEAGLCLFLSALAIRSGQERDAVTLSTSQAQHARLALALRAAGLQQPAIEQQFFALHPELALPEHLVDVSAQAAAAILSGARGAGS